MPHGLAVEEPITSYFPRIGTTRKRRQNSNLVPSTAKRKRPQSRPTEIVNELQKQRTREELVLLDTPRKKSKDSRPETRRSTLRRGSSSRIAPHASSSTSPALLPLSSDIRSANKNISGKIEVTAPSSITHVTNGGSVNRLINSVEDGCNQCMSILQYENIIVSALRR
jgi:hypothetical protein